MATVDHWTLEDITAECFTGDSLADVFDEINTWFRDHPDITVVAIGVSTTDDSEVVTVCYEYLRRAKWS